jgi:hypothetical protein
MNVEVARLIAAPICTCIVGWYVAEIDWQLMLRLSRAAMIYLDPWPRWMICWYAGVTTGMLVGKRRA